MKFEKRSKANECKIPKGNPHFGVWDKKVFILIKAIQRTGRNLPKW